MMSNKEYKTFTVEEWELVKNELMKAYGKLQDERLKLYDRTPLINEDERKQKRIELTKKAQAMKKAWYKAETFYNREWSKRLGS